MKISKRKRKMLRQFTQRGLRAGSQGAAIWTYFGCERNLHKLRLASWVCVCVWSFEEQEEEDEENWK